MRAAQSVIKKPIFTEKSTSMTQASNVITFDVATDANKIEIKSAVQTLFGVKVAAVRVVKTVGKIKKVGKSIGRTSDGKKAYVRLAPGEKLPAIFEGV